MTKQDLRISSLYRKYFGEEQYFYALKVVELGYACEQIPEALFVMYKRECIAKLGSTSGNVEYTDKFIDEIMSLSFFRKIYNYRHLKKSAEIQVSSLKRVANAINCFYSANVSFLCFRESYNNFIESAKSTRFFELSFVEEMLGAKITLDSFQYLLSNMNALHSAYTGKSSSWLHYFIFNDFAKILQDDRSTNYLSLYRSQKSLADFKNVTYLRVTSKTSPSKSDQQGYELIWEDKMIRVGSNLLTIEQFVVSAITFNSWILVYIDGCKIFNCSLPSGAVIDQHFCFFSGNRLHSFFDDLTGKHESDLSNESTKPKHDLICINPVHFLRHLLDATLFPSSVGDSIEFFANTLIKNGISDVRLNSISYLSAPLKEDLLQPIACELTHHNIVSQRLSVRDALVGDALISVDEGLASFLERPLFSNDTLYKQEYNFNPKSNLCFIFCHFDMDGELNESVKHYLNAIAAIGDIIFVSNAPLLSKNESALEFLNKICMNVYVRNNDSYDFGCWAYGITNNLPQIRLHYQALVCCNDSCFGPLCDLKPIIDDFILGDVDVGGLTANKDRGLHLQSYFVFYNKNILASSLFQTFWGNIRSWPEKDDIINHYEVSWLRALILSGFNVSVYFSEYFDSSNNTVMKPLELLQTGFPFIKREVIEKNPFNIDLDQFINSASRIHPVVSSLIHL